MSKTSKRNPGTPARRGVLFAAAAMLALAAVSPAQETPSAPAHCAPAAPRGSSATPTLRVVFADLSSSAGAGDSKVWMDAAEQKVFSKTGFGDAVIVFGVHDHTSESAPIFEASVPYPGNTMEQAICARRALAHARKDGAAALRTALTGPVRSGSTRLVESVRRVPVSRGRATEVIYLSDMLESTHELDLERTKITPRNLRALAQAAIDEVHPGPGALAGVKVYCVLDSPQLGSAPKANNRGALEGFWRLIFESLGGTLVSFDSRLQNQ